MMCGRELSLVSNLVSLPFSLWADMGYTCTVLMLVGRRTRKSLQHQTRVQIQSLAVLDIVS